MEYAIAKVSTKGQIVIPSGLRKGIRAGDEFLMVKHDGRFILKSMVNLASDIKDDLLFAEQVEKAWVEHDKGKFVSKSKDDFLKELRSC
jgi:AbrB family looped-hinge helix DNA binding protein